MYAADLRGAFDLLRMLRLTQEAWTPTARWHIGDLAWDRRLHQGPSSEWPTRLWLDDADDDNTPLAWGWLTLPGDLELVVHDDGDEQLIKEVVDWAISVVGASSPIGTTITREQHGVRSVLEAHGFREVASHGMRYLACDPGQIPAPPVHSGFTVRSLRPGVAERTARADVHIAAWESKTMTEAVYERLQRTWPYRHDLDVVAEVDGRGATRFAASCLAWIDEVNRVGELEPVGTHPDYRRRGLAAAVCAEAVRRLGAAGATRAIVYATGDPGYQAPLSLYQSIGFEEVTRTLHLQRN